LEDINNIFFSTLAMLKSAKRNGYVIKDIGNILLNNIKTCQFSIITYDRYTDNSIISRKKAEKTVKKNFNKYENTRVIPDNKLGNLFQ
jgi:hypothetical protein